MQTREELFNNSLKTAYSLSLSFKDCAEHKGYTLDDVRQAALISLWQATKEFDSTRGAKFNTFAYRAMRNDLVDLNQDKARYYPKDLLPITEFMNGRSYEINSTIEANDLFKKISCILNKDQLELLKMYIEGMSHSEIGKYMGTSQQNISARLKTIFNKIKGAL